MRQRIRRPLLGPLVLSVSVLAALAPADAGARSLYVRQTLGEDHNDGLTPATAWRSLSKLNEALEAGDTAFVGPGLYRDQVFLRNSGRVDAPIRIIADASGHHTGDPPGAVLITGADPVDESIFVAHSTPGVYRAPLDQRVVGVVEMDGPQHRYRGVLEPVRDVPYLDQVAALPASFWYDPDEKVLYLHTSDGEHPSRHELELVRRTGGVSMTGKHFVIVEGFVFRHMFDAGIVFWTGSSHGVALNNTVWGSRQGIRVNGARNIVVTGNTLFRNENSGVYFMNASVAGAVIGNTLYENVKGARWSSQSDEGLAVDNVAFENAEAGLSVESTRGAVLLRNQLIGDRGTPLLVTRSEVHAEGSCVEGRTAPGRPEASSAVPCVPLPQKIDVRELHARSLAYLDAARRRLGAPE